MKKVLIVDDTMYMRASLKLMLENNGFEVIGEAENGKIGVNKYVELKPDLVTMDITMPVMSGIDALRQIKEIDPNAKVVMVSSMGQEEHVKQSLLSGAKSFIVKPFKEEHLLQTLSQVSSL